MVELVGFKIWELADWHHAMKHGIDQCGFR